MKQPVFYIVLASALSLTACNKPSPATATVAPATTNGPAVSTLTDPGAGALCDGKNLRISHDNSSQVIDGECGDVTVTASNGSLNVSKARSITVEGRQFTVLNEQVDTIRVVGSDNVLNLTNARRIDISGNNNMILVNETAEVSFSGTGNTVNASSEPRIEDSGTGNRVI
ncbi:DUF3060 domain-containing protein [Stenotrophomonas sp.]|uniref:DUF3060 domain-containing protein n=1 Tax=Stenotrophomonas sp. TaxID=69392 RepID=UPI0028AD7577|nr:DUF3060 domain-containing protein [Stenotrophomonas sp.]